MRQSDTPGQAEPSALAGRHTALGLATLAFAANFWAWGVLAPLAPDYRALLGLSDVQASLLVATPVLLGSLLRVPFGGLTDRYGGRVMFTACSVATIVPLGLLTVAEGYAALLAAGLLLGAGGASFAVGVPFVAAWFPAHQRGFALGVYGLGNIGTGAASFTAPAMAGALGRAGLFATMLAVLAGVAALVAVAGRDAPGRAPPTQSVTRRLRSALRLRVARDLAGLYAITFGGFVAFGVYLPTYLTEVYGLATADAAARTGGFIVLATLARPAGGWLSDRRGGAGVLTGALAVVGLAAVVVAFAPPLLPATVALLVIAAALGGGSGAVFELVSSKVPAGLVGSVTGVVGAAGGLGGFLPPLVMGLVREATGDYAIGLMLLATVTAAGTVHTWWRFGVLERIRPQSDSTDRAATSASAPATRQ